MIEVISGLPEVALAKATVLSAFKPAFEEFVVADALILSGRATSVPSLATPVELLVAFFAMALGSNLPAYGTGGASSSADGLG